MIRGWYTGASGMAAQQVRLDAIANNLANIDTDGYKRDVTVSKAFAQLLLRRMGDDGEYLHPLGSGDKAPIIGKVGTGVEANEVFTELEQGSLKGTDSDFDLALDGTGFMCVSTPQGERYTRNGSFILGKEGYLETKEGYPVLGEAGPIRVKQNNFQIDKDGRVWVNADYQDDPLDLVGREQNEWGEPVLLDTLKLVDFETVRYIAKQGSSLWRSTEESGPALALEGQDRPKVIQGFTEASNVNPVTEMVRMIEVNRAYEANQKTIQTEDASLGKLINEVAKV
ncbi:MAG TPA: flagellar basal-body rod protein FlgF [Spirochaetia bacterium]|mgnify:FL=1|nr:flagellar basal-body rod protein FlgF [Spirochaetaceae bacterium]HPE88539.1 flagellar basal-body rod protein FlgF [Spirochaetales bacterium]HRW23166.1 flagellar basal-body rod protein FlgF [Spirochaetia bacterium]